MTLPAKEFLRRRYLQHVLPQGFHMVRYYGLLSPANKMTVKRLQLLLTARSGKTEEDTTGEIRRTLRALLSKVRPQYEIRSGQNWMPMKKQ